MANTFRQGGDIPHQEAQLAVADANMVKQAYYIAKAHREGLVDHDDTTLRKGEWSDYQ